MAKKKKKKSGQRRSFRAEQKRHNPWIMGLALAPLALVPLLLTAAAIYAPPIAFFGVHLTAIGIFTSLLAWKTNVWPRFVPIDVEVDDDNLTIGGKAIARDTITRGVAIDQAGGTARISRKAAPDIEIVFDEMSKAHELLKTLGLDASQTVATFSAMSRMQASVAKRTAVSFGAAFGGAALTVLAAVLGAGGVSPVGMLLAMAVILTLLFSRTKVEVGADGIMVRWLGSKRFISHSEIAGVSSAIEGWGRNRRMVVTLELTSGERYRMPTGSRLYDGGNGPALAARIEQALELFGKGDAEPEAFLDRGDRPLERWIAALRKRELVDLRSPVLPKDRLWHVIEDPSAPAVDRAAAAIALGPSLGDDERERLASVARTTAAPKLRVVLEKSEADDKELAEMLEELEAAEPEKKMRA
jgi:hypothetical protein